MKKILIIRSANMETINKLVNYIKENYNSSELTLYCLIQKSSVQSFKDKYNYINYIEKEDGFFSYENYRNNTILKEKLNDIYFDEIYIPSSIVDFPDFEETLMIVSKIKANKNIFFNCYEETYEKKVNFYSAWFDKYFGELVYFIKVLYSLTSIAILYVFSYPYYFIKSRIFTK